MSRLIRVDKDFERRLREMQRELAIRTGKHYTLVEISIMVLRDKNFGKVSL